MLRKPLSMVLLALLVGVSGVKAAELSVDSMAMPPGTTVTLVVSGDVSNEDTYGVMIRVEIVDPGGNTGTLEFTPALPNDITQLGDPWPGGTFTGYDTDITGTVMLNGSVDDDGNYVPAPTTFFGALTGFPVVASANADGTWDVVLSTSAGDSYWEGLTTTLIAGTITVTPTACILDTDCDDGNDCTDNVCAAGVCTYPNLSAGTTCGDPADDDCTNPDTCDGAGTCLDNHEIDGTTCTDEGDDCTDDVCAAGVCTHPNSSVGTACGDPTDDDCTYPDTCDGAGTCLDNHVLDGTACTDEGNDCTDDVCAAGACTHPDLTAGTACGDPTDDDCTYPDTCDGAGTCLDNHELDGATCTDEGNDCTDDVCSSGVCTHPDLTVGTACGDPTDDDCTNPDTCDGAGTCLDNHEVDGTTCIDEGNDCTDDVCSNGVCTHPNMAAGAACGDPGSTVCDNPDTCDGAGTCQANLEPATTECRAVAGSCDVADYCTGSSPACPTDVFEPNTVECRAAAGPCDVADFCTGTAAACPVDAFEPDTLECRASAGPCDVAESCTGSSAACPADAFAPNTVECRPSTADCDAPEFCTGTGSPCPANANEPDGTPCTDDGNVCTDDECQLGFCVHPNNTDPCNDGDPCTENDICAGGACAGTPIGGCVGCTFDSDCDDGDDCTDNICSGGVCIYPYSPTGTLCGDQSVTVCDNANTCDGAGVCQPNYEPATTQCRASADICDLAEYCTGSSAACPANGFEPDTTMCRSAAGPCDVAEYCTGIGTTCPADAVAPGGTECRAVANECDVAEYCDGILITCATDDFQPDGLACTPDADSCTDDICQGGACSHPLSSAGTVCRPAAGLCDIEETCTGSSPTCPSDVREPPTTECRPSAGPCDIGDYCDGASPQCPADVFVPGFVQCRASAGPCDVAEDCTGDAAGCPTDVFEPSSLECRASAGVCDVADFCTGFSAACPSDEFEANTIECRASAGPCDVAEFCTGTGTDCPADALEPGTVECRAAAGPCDVPESCTGSSPACPANGFEPSTVECNPSAGPCDVPEFCTGISAACPTDVFEPNTLECRAVAGPCDVSESCTGSSADCPVDVFEPNSLECRASAGPCDVADYCTGSSAVCPTDVFQPNTLECRTSAGFCDVAEYCTGGSADCPADAFEPPTVECRPAVGLCDITEYCTGSGASCPANALEPNTVECRPPAFDCDASEFCNGFTPDCPADVNEPDGTLCTDDGNVCTDDECQTGTCVHPDNVDPCNDADPCTENDVCSGGVCAGTPIGGCVGCTLDSDCDDGNDCTDNICSGGVCTNPYLTAGTACGDATDDDCTNPDTCDGAGACLDNHEVGGTICSDDGNDCTDDLCTAGVCTHPNFSAGTACGDPTDDDCTNPDTCDGIGVCLDNHEVDGTGCTDEGNDCTDDVCAAGVCTYPNSSAGTPCGDPTDDDCTYPDTCDGAGTCLDNHVADGTACPDEGNDCTYDSCTAGTCTHANLAAGSPCGDTTTSDCTYPDTCDGAGTCLDNHELDGTTCADDGNECTDDVCTTGVCTHPNLAAGTACGDPMDDDCNNPDACDGAGACLINHEVDGTVCTDDGIDCTDDVCSLGVCIHPDSPTGAACGDSTNNACTNPDTCDGAGACLDNHEVDGTQCGFDGNACTDDVCASGVCTHPNSPAGVPCGDPTDDDCTAPDTCDGAGTCLDNHETDGVACTDEGNDCTDDVCATGTCTHPNRAAGTACGDATDDVCTNPDTCNGAGTCLNNHETDGTFCTDDGNECTDDVCSAGICTHPNFSLGAPCGDPTADECTNPDTCDGMGACLDNHKADGMACTGDGNDCTSDVCAVGVCTHPNWPTGMACGDATDNACTNRDTCDGAGNCLDNHQPDGTQCGFDGNACTDDVCASGVCTHPNSPLGAPCGDPTDDDCTAPDTCDGAGTCLDNHQADGIVCTDDGSDCTDDVCDAGTCTHPYLAAGTVCGDPTDNDCTNPDTCNSTGTCLSNHVADGTTCTDDGNECTDDVCSAGACAHPDFSPGTSCGDPTDDDCTNPDTCDGAGLCLDNHESDGAACTDDGNDCTNDVCAAGACTHPNLAAGTTCGDPTDDECTNPDTCNGAGTCLSNHESDGTTCTDDGNECTDDICGTGVCTHPGLAAGTSCGDPTGDDCTSPDTCDGAGICLDNHEADGTTCTDDGNDCTGDVCASGACTHPNLATGTACGDPTDSDCTNPDTCDGAGVCLMNHEVDGATCTDDDNDCTNDVCAVGTCTHPNLGVDVACGDPTDDDCTNPDTCDGTGTCLGNHEVDGTACTNDGNECTDDVCTGGACAHPSLSAGTACGDPTDDVCDNPDACDGNGACADNLEPNGTACSDDGNACTSDVCGAGVCIHPTLCGACCHPFDFCTDAMTEDACIAQNGTWSEGLACLGDADGDGIDDLCEQADFSPCETQSVVASDATANDNFGYAVAVSGNLSVVGVRLDSDTGAAYVFRLEGAGWVEEEKLIASDLGVGDLFGTAVAISGGLVVVGASQNDAAGANSGAAYVFRREGMSWVEEAKLVASDGAAQDRFGVSVGFSGDAVVVGASLDDDAGSASGSAYVFRRSGITWTQEAKLTASDAGGGDQFGSAVSIDGDLVVVGSPADGGAGPASGSAYVFRWNGSGWFEEYKLVASDAESNDWFGSSVSAGGDLVLIGAKFDDDVESNSGSAYVFRHESPLWVQEAKLTASNPGASHQFGFAVSTSGSLALIGAFQDNAAGPSSGSAYMFRRSGVTWVDETKLTSFDAAPGDQFGHSVSISGIVAVVGAAFDDDGGTDSGSVYFFDLAGPDSDGDGVLDTCDICPGSDDTVDTDGDGVPDGCDACPGFDDSVDCDADGTPDACAIAQCSSDPACQDCNSNGIPDGCDIAAGTSLDINSNGVPDECETICLPPLVESVGSRYIAITPQPEDSDVSVSILITSPDWPCVSMYVGGFLECGETGQGCRTIADCNSCTGPLGGSCLIDDDCKTCQDAIANPCETDEDCNQTVLCQLTETCDITGDNCAPHLPLDTIDVNEDGLVDGIVASLVDDPADAVSITPQQWTAGVDRCSVSFVACTDDSDCDVGACSISGTACSLAAPDCDDVCAIGLWECTDDSHCTLPGDTCSVSQTCEPFETCDPGKLYVTAEAIWPSKQVRDGPFTPTTYAVQGDCNGLTDPVEVTMRVWADANDNRTISMGDVQLHVMGFEGEYPIDIPARTLVSVDPIGGGSTQCGPNRRVNFTDVQIAVFAFEGQHYEDTGCPTPCP